MSVGYLRHGDGDENERMVGYGTSIGVEGKTLRGMLLHSLSGGSWLRDPEPAVRTGRVTSPQ